MDLRMTADVILSFSPSAKFLKLVSQAAKLKCGCWKKKSSKIRAAEEALKSYSIYVGYV